MLNICVDLLFLQPRRNRGTDSYVAELLQELAAIPTVGLVLILNRAIAHQFSGLATSRLYVPAISGRNRVVRVVYQQFMLPRVAQRLGAEVLFCPGYLSPIWSGVPVVVTIHDTQFRDVPNSISWGQRFIYNRVLPKAARTAHRVITVSEFSRNRIHEELRIPLERVSVIHTGPRRSRGELPKGPALQEWRQSRGLTRPYVLSVSSGLAHKNSRGLVAGFRCFQSRCGSSHDLVLAGQSTGELARLGVRAGGGVRALGYVPDEELQALYANSAGFVLASTYEGFGMPVLEAMQHGIPVACSDVASLPEIAGNGALLFNPRDPESLGRALEELLLDDARRNSLITAGYANLRRFSWRRCAEATLRILEHAAEGSPEVAGGSGDSGVGREDARGMPTS